MKKDVIYIDTEDDITAIIEKVKGAKASIVALVPPKRVGVLQSIVNLKLLQRAANTSDKRIVLITNDQALVGLSAGLAIPVAKNLQSKPEIAAIAALESEGDDVINGEELPVGEFVSSMSSDEAMKEGLGLKAGPNSGEDISGLDMALPKDEKTPKKDGIKIPNFNTFRNKLFLFGGLGVLLLALSVWALIFVGQADVTITAKTNVVNIAKTLQLVGGGKLDAKQSVLPAVIKQVKKTSSVDFQATGKKDVGEKSTGVVTLVNDGDSDSITVPAGTVFTATGGLDFTLNSAATVPGARLSGGAVVAGTATGAVTAESIGGEYNVGAQSLTTSGPTKARFDEATSGGSKKTITVVTADDIAKAQEKLSSQDSNAVKTELTKQFSVDEIAITDAFTVETGTPVSVPALDQEATAGKLNSDTVYTLIGMKRSDLKAIYDEYLNSQLKNGASQKIYDSGDKATQFAQFQKNDAGYTVKVTANAQIGPNIDTSKLAEDLKGKRTGEVQQLVGNIQGIEDVNVNLSPFWVTKVPNDINRIKITFVLKNE